MKNKNRRNIRKDQSLGGEEGLDPSSAFVQRGNRGAVYSGGSKSSTPSSSNHIDNNLEVELAPSVRAAQQLALQGNQLFNAGKYKDAVQYFTEAIKLDPQEVRFFGNRALCFQLLNEFEKALEDADTAIALQATWPRGHFRRAEAFEGLGKLEDSERSFEQTLKLDPDCIEGDAGRRRVMVKQLTRLGFSKEQSQAAVEHYPSVKSAVDSLLATRLMSSSALHEVLDSDDEEALVHDRYTCNRIGRLQDKAASPSNQNDKNYDPLLDPKNPLQWDTLWVGNLTQQTTEKMIVTMFSKYGKIKHSHMMLDKHCAFLSYADYHHAGDAMRDLQNKEFNGQRMLIKYPDRALTNASPNNLNANFKANANHSIHQPLVLRKSQPHSGSALHSNGISKPQKAQ